MKMWIVTKNWIFFCNNCQMNWRGHDTWHHGQSPACIDAICNDFQERRKQVGKMPHSLDRNISQSMRPSKRSTTQSMEMKKQVSLSLVSMPTSERIATHESMEIKQRFSLSMPSTAQSFHRQKWRPWKWSNAFHNPNDKWMKCYIVHGN